MTDRKELTMRFLAEKWKEVGVAGGCCSWEPGAEATKRSWGSGCQLQAGRREQGGEVMVRSDGENENKAWNVRLHRLRDPCFLGKRSKRSREEAGSWVGNW